MYLTIFKPEEAEKILNNIKFPFDSENILPYAHDPFTTLNGLVFDNNGVVALGICRLVNEFKVIINPNVGRLKIAVAINKLISSALVHCHKSGSNEIFVILTQGGIPYSKFLTKHFDFEKIDGIAMKKEV